MKLSKSRFATWSLALMTSGFLGVLSSCGVGGEVADNETVEGSSEALISSTYMPVADTFLSQASPTTAFGETGYFSAAGGTGTQRVAFLRFSFIPPQGRVVKSAELVLTNGGYAGSNSAAGGKIRKFNPTTPSWSDNPYLWPRSVSSPGPIYTWNNPLAGTDATGDLSTVGAVASGGKYTFGNLASTIPVGGDGWTYKDVTYVIRSTSADDVGYISSENATASLRPTLKVTWGNADWAITSFSATATATAVTINYSVRNNGELTSKAVSIRFHASASYATTTSNILCSETVPALAAGASYPSTGTRRLVCTIPTGTLSPALTAWIDPTGTVSETDEANNKVQIWKPIGPDLALLGAATFTTGLDKVTCSSPGIKNLGTVTAAASRLGFYIQKGSTSQKLCDVAIPSLAPGARYPASGNLVVSCPTTAFAFGSYLPLSVADHTNLVKEGDEGNNQAYISGEGFNISIGPDLFVSRLTASASSTTVSGTYSVKNIGTKPITVATKTRFQLAKLYYVPQRVDTDYVVATVSTPALSPGQTTSGSFSGPKPAWTTGYYNFYAVADATKLATEVDEWNVTSYAPSSGGLRLP